MRCWAMLRSDILRREHAWQCIGVIGLGAFVWDREWRQKQGVFIFKDVTAGNYILQWLGDVSVCRGREKLHGCTRMHCARLCSVAESEILQCSHSHYTVTALCRQHYPRRTTLKRQSMAHQFVELSAFGTAPKKIIRSYMLIQKCYKSAKNITIQILAK
ncbi:hypothetical protein BDQ17DRAFT_1339250 [Cyathus striatus]|nr:hypothetical protein BDQ17DRAFT_1339250 [Cyathus striatus]